MNLQTESSFLPCGPSARDFRGAWASPSALCPRLFSVLSKAFQCHSRSSWLHLGLPIILGGELVPPSVAYTRCLSTFSRTRQEGEGDLGGSPKRDTDLVIICKVLRCGPGALNVENSEPTPSFTFTGPKFLIHRRYPPPFSPAELLGEATCSH